MTRQNSLSPPVRTNIQELPLQEISWEFFEMLCLRIINDIEKIPPHHCDCYGRRGQKQGGIDIYARVGSNYNLYQVKRYNRISLKDLRDIFEKFENGEWLKKANFFIICTAARFDDINLQNLFEEYRNEFLKKDIQVEKWDFSYINRCLKHHPQIVYDFFGKDWCIAFCGEDVFNHSVISFDFSEIQKSIQNASYYLSGIKNFFENNKTTHIEREETSEIINWLIKPLSFNEKNILILEGDKGLGKSVVLKDVYDKLLNDFYPVLAIKADKYYAESPSQLEDRIFANPDITFQKLIASSRIFDKPLVIIIDQIDALSQTLSSRREYLQTYIRIIQEFIGRSNIRVVISCRSFDLNYDAELSRYRTEGVKQIKIKKLTPETVTKVLKQFNVSATTKEITELLSTPSHMEAFTKLPSKGKLNINALVTVKDLYDKLWEDLVMNSDERASFLCEIAREMSFNQKITLKNKFTSAYSTEISFFRSNGIIILDIDEIQFFHQTFYEYCFAKQFVLSNSSLTEFILKQEQSLYARSVVKLVCEYLREYDLNKYISEITQIIKSKRFRFHIKSLICTNLALIEKPYEHEINLVKRLILRNKEYEDVFISSVYSYDWVNFLISKNYTSKFLIRLPQSWERFNRFIPGKILKRLNEKKKKRDEFLINQAWRLFANNINQNSLEILKYLDEINFDEKSGFIARVITQIDNWKSADLLFYFDKYLPYHKKKHNRDNFWFYQIIEKIVINHEDYVFVKIEPIFEEIFKDAFGNSALDHNEKSCIEALFLKTPKRSYDFFLSIYSKIIDENQTAYGNTMLYKSRLFYDLYSSVNYAEIEIENLLLKYLIKKTENKVEFHPYFESLKISNSIMLLRLLVLALSETSQTYLEEIFELIQIVHTKNGFCGSDDRLQFYFRRLIGKTYSLYNFEQQERLNEVLLSVRWDYDCKFFKYDTDGKKTVHFTGVGKKQYLFLKAIPLLELSLHSSLKKRFQELSRRFGKINDDRPMDVSSFSTHGVFAPLSVKAYENMSSTNWKKSFKKFNSDYNPGIGSEKGGLREHANKFKDSVKKEAGGLYSLVLELFSDSNIDHYYLYCGIDGLIEADFNPQLVLQLFKKLIALDLNSENTLYSVWKIDFFIKHRLMDRDLINYLKDLALHHSSPNKALNDPLFDGPNSVRSAAIMKLMSCYEYKEFEYDIFLTVEKAVNDPQMSVKVAIITNVAFLNYFDKNRAFKIFMQLVNLNEVDLLRYSFNQSQYFNWEFHKEMDTYFEKIIANRELHKDGALIVLNWINEKFNDYQYYKKFITASNEAKLCAIKVAEANLFKEDSNINKKSLDILFQFLREKDEKFADAYSGLVLRKFTVANFPIFYNFLLLYSKGDLFKREPGYLLELLLKCSANYPKESLNILSNLDFSEVPNAATGYFYDKEPVQLVLAIYSKLSMEAEKDNKAIKHCLKLFDEMLKFTHLRQSANQAINTII